MAFDRPVEADSVKDSGLLSSLIRAPVVGILWLLGGEHSKDEEDDNKKESGPVSMNPERLGDGIREESSFEEAPVTNSAKLADISAGCFGLKLADETNNSGPGVDSSLLSAKPTNSIHNKENSSPQRPQDYSDNDLKYDRKQVPIVKKSRPPSSSHNSTMYNEKHDIIDASMEMIDDLVSAMERSNTTGDIPGPATNAFLNSHCVFMSSSSATLSASYSATTFSTTYPSQSCVNTDANPSLPSNQDDSNSSIRGNKKMSWSDEAGNRSLVEYFDDSTHPLRSRHWSNMKRNSKEFRHSFDGTEKGTGTFRSDIKVIKSALKRCGSYSPPVSLHPTNVSSGDASNSSSVDTSSSSPEMKSFRSISMIGSSDSSGSTSQDTDDSMAAVTDKFINSNECVPSSLQFGGGQSSGGLIIPRGGPSHPRNFCQGGSNDSKYQLILGASVLSSRKQNAGGVEGETGTIQDVSSAKASNPVTSNSPIHHHHHHFLPRHGNGYVSPQYGFYVNITPPTPELYAKAWDKSSKLATQQQSYLQFQCQDKFKAPSPIPEGSPGGNDVITKRFVGRSSVPRPSSNRSSHEQEGKVDSMDQKSMKPTFTKNKNGMGMLFVENSHHGAWPTVPFG